MTPTDQDMVLAKTSLPLGWIDMGIGEADVIYSSITSTLPKGIFTINPDDISMHYMTPRGYSPFVKTLEAKYESPCIVTVGAKQALMVSFLSMKKLGFTKIAITSPYWTSIPSIVETCGMELVVFDNYDSLLNHFWNNPSEINNLPVLIVSPNNPDSVVVDKSVFSQLNTLKAYIIHDAAYENELYGFDNTDLKVDMKIYSAAKQYGISAARIGWIVTKDVQLMRFAEEITETLSSSAGILDQILTMRIMNILTRDSKLYKIIRSMTQDVISSRRHAFLSQLDSKYFDKDGIEFAKINQNGIFIWLKKSEIELIPSDIKIRWIDGANFGDSRYIRLCIGNLNVEGCLLASSRFSNEAGHSENIG